MRTDWEEGISSLSQAGVVRGMHFQTPPDGHAKLVTCMSGAIMDAVVDLRVGSPTYGEHRTFDLEAGSGRLVYIPTGFGHGFVARKDNSLVVYQATRIHSPDHDKGVAWDSIGIDWGVADPVLSDRDRVHPTLADFDSPFVFQADNPFQ